MARIPYFDPATAEGRLKDTLEKLPNLNIFLMMGHSGDLLAKFTGLGNHILGRADLDQVLREIAIVRVGILSKASYEVFQHERICRQIGMSEDLVKAITEGPDAAAFDDLQRLVMRYTDDIVLNVRASDATFDPLSKHLSHKEMQELTLTIGYYMMVSRFLETFDVDIEEDGQSEGVNMKDLER
ncbi:MAG: carboxymuconolactone decarboxylase [Rhodobiaceae bacterium]|nr:MAG: carboxymuconolactone decarboxylase [Rhodobiaceae bacterium]